MNFSKKKILPIVVLIMLTFSIVVFGNISRWQKIVDERVKVFNGSKDNKTYIVSKSNPENGLPAMDTINEYILLVDDPSQGIGKTKKLILKYEILDNNKKLLGFVEENTGISYDLTKDRDKLVFEYGFNSIWIADNHGNSNKILEIGRNNVKNNGYEGEYPVLVASPKFTYDGSKILYMSNCDEIGLNKTMNLWIVDSNGNNNKIFYKSKGRNLNFIGWKDNNTIILLEENNIISFDIRNGQTEAIINNVTIESVSLDYEKLIYAPLINNTLCFDQLTVYNINTKQSYILPDLTKGFTYSGFISWAPDSEKFAFLASNVETEKSVIIVTNISSNEQKIYDDYDSPLQINPEDNPIQWLNENQVAVTMHDKYDYSKKQTWLVNINE